MIVFFKWGKEKIPTFYLFFRLQSTKKGILSFFRKLPKKVISLQFYLQN